MFLYTHTDHSPTPADDGDDPSEIRSSRVITVTVVVVEVGQKTRLRDDPTRTLGDNSGPNGPNSPRDSLNPPCGHNPGVPTRDHKNRTKEWSDTATLVVVVVVVVVVCWCWETGGEGWDPACAA